MKNEKYVLHKEVAKVGTKHIDHYNLETIEAVTMTAAAVLSITLGTIYGTILF